MQVPILNGIYTDNAADFRTSYPLNLIPVPKGQGISNGYLRPAEGVVKLADTPGADRGGINWNGVCYRVCGTKLVSVSKDGTVATIGEVGTGSNVTFDYSFDYLAVCSGGDFYLYDGTTLAQVTDPDLGVVLDFTWVDGYFMTTDGVNLVVTDLSDPFAVNPLKYGSSEVDPDNIVAVIKLRDEIYAVNRYTVEVFNNVGGTGFPFERVPGAQVTRGAVGTHSVCKYLDALAFIGSARNEAPAVWLASGGTTQKVSTREVDQVLAKHSEAALSTSLVESRVSENHTWLYVHLPGVTLVYDSAASQVTGEPVWFRLSSGLTESAYLARNHVWCYDKWIVGHPSSSLVGYVTDESGDHWGAEIGWEFGTTIIFNQANGALFHRLELVSLTGRTELGYDPLIYTQYSLDGETYSQPKFVRAGKTGDRAKRLVWLRQGSMKNWRIQKFQGTSKARLTFARLEVTAEPLVF